MIKKSLFNNLPYLPKLWAAILYFILLIAAIFLLIGRTNPNIRIPLLLKFFPDLYLHISNFFISFVLCLAIGYISMMWTKSMKPTVVVALLLLVINFVYEWFIPIFNTPDKIDAYYGFVGTILPFAYLFFYRKYGLNQTSNFKQKEK